LTAEGFDPYRIWLGIPREEQPPNHYRLLGIGVFESDPDVIAHAADRQMAHVRTFQTGQYSALSQEILNRLAAVRVCLLDPDKKARYDAELRAQLASRAPPPAPPPRAATPPPPRLEPKSPPPATRPDIPQITASPELLRTRAAGGQLRRRTKASWVVPVLAIILATLLVIALVIIKSRQSNRIRSPVPSGTPGFVLPCGKSETILTSVA
jgi:hypothetical protein